MQGNNCEFNSDLKLTYQSSLSSPQAKATLKGQQQCKLMWPDCCIAAMIVNGGQTKEHGYLI